MLCPVTDVSRILVGVAHQFPEDQHRIGINGLRDGEELNDIKPGARGPRLFVSNLLER
jgi:hypothetical protein